MSDTAPAPSTDDAGSQTDASEPDTGDQTPDPTAELEKWKAQARKHEERAKANAKAAKELEDFKRQSMSETEKAIDEARSEGRQQALAEAGSKVAAAELRAAATGRMTAEQMDTLLDGVNLTRFLADDGEVDRAAISAFVDGIAPARQNDPALPDLGQGARSPQSANHNSRDAFARDLFGV